MILKAARGSGAAGTKFRFNPGYPVFNRIQFNISSGPIICDIDDYHILQKLLGNFDPEYEGQAHLTGDYRGQHADNDDETALSGAGVTIQHNILAGLFSQDHYIPVGMFSGSAGHAFEITLSLNDPKMCMSTVEEHDSDFSYTLSNAHMQVEVVQLPESVSQKTECSTNERRKSFNSDGKLPLA
jgi:hypothetical protein